MVEYVAAPALRASEGRVQVVFPSPTLMVLTLVRHERPRALTIKVEPDSQVERDDLVRFNLAARPFIRDLLSGRIFVFWELLTPTGICLVLRDQEIYSDIEELARLEV